METAAESKGEERKCHPPAHDPTLKYSLESIHKICHYLCDNYRQLILINSALARLPGSKRSFNLQYNTTTGTWRPKRNGLFSFRKSDLNNIKRLSMNTERVFEKGEGRILTKLFTLMNVLIELQIDIAIPPCRKNCRRACPLFEEICKKYKGCLRKIFLEVYFIKDNENNQDWDLKIPFHAYITRSILRNLTNLQVFHVQIAANYCTSLSKICPLFGEVFFQLWNNTQISEFHFGHFATLFDQRKVLLGGLSEFWTLIMKQICHSRLSSVPGKKISVQTKILPVNRVQPDLSQVFNYLVCLINLLPKVQKSVNLSLILILYKRYTRIADKEIDALHQVKKYPFKISSQTIEYRYESDVMPSLFQPIFLEEKYILTYTGQ